MGRRRTRRLHRAQSSGPPWRRPPALRSGPAARSGGRPQVRASAPPVGPAGPASREQDQDRARAAARPQESFGGAARPQEQAARRPLTGGAGRAAGTHEELLGDGRRGHAVGGRRVVRRRHEHARRQRAGHALLLQHAPGLLVELGPGDAACIPGAVRPQLLRPHDLGIRRRQPPDRPAGGPDGLPRRAHGLQRAGPLRTAPERRRRLPQLRHLRAHVPLRLPRAGAELAADRRGLQGGQPERRRGVAGHGRPLGVREHGARLAGVQLVAADAGQPHEVLHRVDAVLQGQRDEAELRRPELLGRDQRAPVPRLRVRGREPHREGPEVGAGLG
mmetsp:Transcript_912/g.2848  ORF Transcript_912/g.2848 Transcript_912/m.2848 type:complete len:332 (-) Transcript_912:401-1396(-)